MTITQSGSNPVLSSQVAAEIRAWMGRREIRQTQLAASLGVTDQWLSMRLKGRTPIDLNELQRIAWALDVQVVDLLPGAARQAGPTTLYARQHRPAREALAPRLAEAKPNPSHAARGAHAMRVHPRRAV